MMMPQDRPARSRPVRGRLGPQLRSALYEAYFIIVTLLFGLAALPIRWFARGRALGFARSWARTALAGLAPICGIRLAVTGLHHLPDRGPMLLASQHQSVFDTMVWMSLLERPCYVMKQELTRIPLFGPMLVPAGMIPVDRAAGASALRRLILDTEAARVAGRQIVIFPEGTRVPPGHYVPLQPGIAAIAARLGLPVLPVATDSGMYWTRDWLGKRAGTIHVAIGPPILCTTPRATMLAQIEAFWRLAEQGGFGAVDKSVDQQVPAGSLFLK
jgi:1-acyl-sn-glycerol-3-phosphate acyltransferase